MGDQMDKDPCVAGFSELGELLVPPLLVNLSFASLPLKALLAEQATHSRSANCFMRL